MESPLTSLPTKAVFILFPVNDGRRWSYSWHHFPFKWSLILVTSTYGGYWHKAGSWFGSLLWLSSCYLHCSSQSMSTAPLCCSILCFTPALMSAGRDHLAPAAPCFVPSSHRDPAPEGVGSCSLLMYTLLCFFRVLPSEGSLKWKRKPEPQCFLETWK